MTAIPLAVPMISLPASPLPLPPLQRRGSLSTSSMPSSQRATSVGALSSIGMNASPSSRRHSDNKAAAASLAQPFRPIDEQYESKHARKISAARHFSAKRSGESKASSPMSIFLQASPRSGRSASSYHSEEADSSSWLAVDHHRSGSDVTAPVVCPHIQIEEPEEVDLESVSSPVVLPICGSSRRSFSMSRTAEVSGSRRGSVSLGRSNGHDIPLIDVSSPVLGLSLGSDRNSTCPRLSETSRARGRLFAPRGESSCDAALDDDVHATPQLQLPINARTGAEDATSDFAHNVPASCIAREMDPRHAFAPPPLGRRRSKSPHPPSASSGRHNGKGGASSSTPTAASMTAIAVVPVIDIVSMESMTSVDSDASPSCRRRPLSPVSVDIFLPECVKTQSEKSDEEVDSMSVKLSGEPPLAFHGTHLPGRMLSSPFTVPSSVLCLPEQGVACGDLSPRRLGAQGRPSTAAGALATAARYRVPRPPHRPESL